MASFKHLKKKKQSQEIICNAKVKSNFKSLVCENLPFCHVINCTLLYFKVQITRDVQNVMGINLLSRNKLLISVNIIIFLSVLTEKVGKLFIWTDL